MICIFCLKEKPSSREHVIPDAMGGGLTTDRVCTDCNSSLGTEVDCYLTDHTFIQLARQQHQIASRTGHIPTWQDAFGYSVLADDENQRVRAKQVTPSSPVEIEVLYNKFVSEDGQKITIKVDAAQSNEIPKIIQRERRRLGTATLSAEEMEAFIQKNVSEHELEQPWVKHDLKIDLKQYQRAVVKIAYELAFLYFGDGYLQDGTALKLRQFIRGGTDRVFEGQIGFEPIQLFDELWPNEDRNHTAVVIDLRGTSLVWLRLFKNIHALIVVRKRTSESSHFGGRYFHFLTQSWQVVTQDIENQILAALTARK